MHGVYIKEGRNTERWTFGFSFTVILAGETKYFKLSVHTESKGFVDSLWLQAKAIAVNVECYLLKEKQKEKKNSHNELWTNESHMGASTEVCLH